MKPNDHRTVQRVLDGDMSPEDFTLFQQRLREEPGLAKLYSDYAVLSHSLTEEFGDVPVRVRPQAVVRKTQSSPLKWLALAAVIALGALMLWRVRLPLPVAPVIAVANVRFSADAVWAIEGRAGGPATLVPGSTLQLIQGRAEFAPTDGVEAMLEGPATLQMLSSRSLHLSQGRGRFEMRGADGSLQVTTPSMVAEDLGTAFGVLVAAGLPDELHVFEGAVRMRINGNASGETLAAGEAGRVAGAAGIERIPANDQLFPEELGSFETQIQAPFSAADWRIAFGSPSISPDRIDGGNFAAFLKLPQAAPVGDHHVLLVTMTVAEPADGVFHTDGWAGLSLFREGEELVFFGDSFGPEKTWSLDVKQHIPVILPVLPLVGPRTVTLRYERTTGAVSLHEGGQPLRPAFCSGTLPPGCRFDEIRIGASSAGALAVDSLTVQTGG